MQQNNLLANIKKLALFAMPISMTMLINMISGFASMLILAKLGEDELAAGALAIPTFITVMMVTPIFYAVGILISHTRGQGKSAADIGKWVKNGFWLAILIAIPTSIFLWNADAFLLFIKQDPHLVILTKNYFHYAALCIPAILIIQIITQFYAGIGIAKISLIVSIISVPVTIMLAYALILGQYGLPKFALAGITISTLIVQTLVCIGLFCFMFLKDHINKYELFSGGLLPNWLLCKKILSLGLPIGIQFIGELAAMTMITYLTGYFGATALAAGQIVSQYVMLTVMIILGLSQALGILISEAYGRQDVAQIRQYLNAAIILFALFVTTIFIAFMLTPEYLTKLFIGHKNFDNISLIKLTITFFSISAVVIIFDGARNLFSSALRGLQDAKVPMNIALFSLWIIALPTAYLIGIVLGFGAIGLRLGFLSGFVIAAIWLWNRILRKIDAVDNAKIQNAPIATMEQNPA